MNTQPPASVSAGADGLLPCPFCGSPAIVEEIPTGLGAGGVSFSVGCNSQTEVSCMGYQTLTTFSRRSEAVKAWNTRAAIPSDELREAGRPDSVKEMLRDALSAVQWAGRDRHRCVECGGQPSTGHTEKCRVGRALALSTTGEKKLP